MEGSNGYIPWDNLKANDHKSDYISFNTLRRNTEKQVSNIICSCLDVEKFYCTVAYCRSPAALLLWTNAGQQVRLIKPSMISYGKTMTRYRGLVESHPQLLHKKLCHILCIQMAP